MSTLVQQRDDLKRRLFNAETELRELREYLRSDKFEWPNNDYVYVRTDILPKIEAVLNALVFPE